MKRISRHLFLSLLARVPVAASRAGTPPRILLMRPDHLGDLLFMTPALHALRIARPDAHIACLIGPWGEPILRDNPDVDEIVACDFPFFNRRPKSSAWAPYATLWREAQRLRAMRFDAAYIMRFDFWWGAALARLAGIPVRIGYALPGVQPFLTAAVPYVPGMHEVEQNLRLVEGGAHPLPLSRPQEWGVGDTRFTITPADAAWAAARLADSGSPDSGPRTPDPGVQTPEPCFVALHPGAGAAVKLWTVDGWVKVCNELAQRHGAALILTGGASDVSLVQSIASRLSAPHIVLAGETSLGQLAAVFAHCRLVLGADSGPLHLAVAVGSPTVHLFGPVDPVHFGAWGDPDKHIIIQARFFDLPCHNRPCNRLDYTTAELPQHPCMQTITAEDVLAAAETILRKQT